jgi:predicted RNA methylase
MAFYVGLARKAGEPLVELAIGTGRVAIPVAQATGQRVIGVDASPAMLEGERLAPEQVRTHALVRDLVRELISISGRRAPEELVDLAKRCAAMP